MKNLKLKDYTLLTNDEHEKLLQIRNTKEVREVSFDEKVINLDEHLSWIKKLKVDKTKKYFAVIYNDELIGGVSLYDANKDIKWGIFFDAKTSLIIKSIIPICFIDYLFDNFKCEELFSEIKKNNLNAISYNKSLGFEVFKDAEVVVMQLNKSHYIKAKNGMILKRIIKKINLYNFKMETT